MATTVARLEAVLAANTRDFDRAMTRSDSRMRKVGKTAGIVTGAVGTVLVAGLAKSVKEAIQAEKSQARLEQSFKQNIKGGIEPYRKRLEEAGSAARNLGFDDEELADSIGSLIVPTRNYEDAQKAANIAMDLARFKGVSLEGATKMLTMAMAGSQRATKQLGITVPTVTTTFDELKARFTSATSEGGKTITMTEKLSLENAKLIDKQKTAGNVIDIVSQKVKGQAKAYAETTEGGMKVFKEQVEELQEKIGTALLPALNKIVDVLTRILQFFERHPKLGQAVMIGLATAIGLAVTAQIALNLAILANPYVAATVAIIALAAGVALLWAKVKELRPVIALVSFYVLGLPAGITLLLAAFGKLNPVIEAITGAFRRMAGWLKTVVDKVKWLIDNLGKIGGALGRIPGISGGGGPSSSNSGLIPMVTNAVGAAREMGWNGVVTSGFRTYEEQAALYARYLAGGPLAAKPGTSSHEKGQAVDVTDYGTFGRMMNRLPVGLRLYNKLGARDPVHFSVTGYAKGGIVPGPIGAPQLAMVHGGETITPPGGDINLYVDGQKLFTWFRNEKRRRERRGDGF